MRKGQHYESRDFFTGTGPILILTTFGSLSDPQLIEKLSSKAIKKYIAHKISEDKVREKYGKHFNIVMGDLHQSDDLRVLDYDGRHVFNNYTLKELGEPIFHEG